MPELQDAVTKGQGGKEMGETRKKGKHFTPLSPLSTLSLLCLSPSPRGVKKLVIMETSTASNLSKGNSYPTGKAGQELVAYLRSLSAIRSRCSQIFDKALTGKLRHFDCDLTLKSYKI
jgi:hypothetical protein